MGQGSKRFLLLGAEQTPKLYGFPTLHALDPLSRVDLEASKEELTSRWPRIAEARGAAVTLEAGDALIFPQGVWHHVHSLERENVSLSFLFALGEGEACGSNAAQVRLGKLRADRQPAALAELAKTAEGFVGQAVGHVQAAEVIQAAHMAVTNHTGAVGRWGPAIAAL